MGQRCKGDVLRTRHVGHVAETLFTALGTGEALRPQMRDVPLPHGSDSARSRKCAFDPRGALSNAFTTLGGNYSSTCSKSLFQLTSSQMACSVLKTRLPVGLTESSDRAEMRTATKILIVLVLQLVSWTCEAATATAALAVTVTVVRPAPVTTVADPNLLVRDGTRSSIPASISTTAADGVQYIVIEY